MRTGILFLSLISLLVLNSCATYDRSRPVVQQGNLLTEAKLSRLHAGMSKQDAAVLMGDSLISPTFTHDRWDYAYTLQKNGKNPEIHHLSLYFSEGRLIKIERDA